MPSDDEPINFEELARLQNLDEQIDRRLRERTRSPDQQEALDPAFLRDLRDIHQPRAQAFQNGLDRVWRRLEQRGVSSVPSHQPSTGLPNPPGMRDERFPPMQRIFRTGPRWPARLTTLVAVALLAVLVGSLTLGLILVHRGGSPTAGNPTPTQAPTAAPTNHPPTGTPGSSVGFSITSVHMIDATTGWAQGPAVKSWRIARTTDGGAHWQDVTPAAGSSDEEVPAYFLNASTAWVVLYANDTGSPTIFRTTDGGQTWQREAALNQPYYLSQLIFINPQDGWMLNTQGATGNEVADLYRTTNGGASWNEIATTGMGSNPGAIPFDGSTKGVGFLNASTGWMTSFSNRTDFFWLYVTHDGGVTWQQQTLPPPPNADQGQYDLRPPVFFNAQDGIMSAQVGPTANGASAADVYVTHDGGATWQPTALVQANDRLISFTDANHGWATDGTTLFSTSDGGQHWTQLPASSVFHDVTSLNVVSPTTGWAISQPASGALILLKTTDGGQTWTVVTPILVS